MWKDLGDVGYCLKFIVRDFKSFNEVAGLSNVKFADLVMIQSDDLDDERVKERRYEKVGDVLNERAGGYFVEGEIDSEKSGVVVEVLLGERTDFIVGSVELFELGD